MILALNGLSDGDLRWEMGFTFLIGLSAGIGIWKLARQTLGRNARFTWIAVFAANLVIFSPLQWENWLWAIQCAFMLPMTCLIWALVAVGSRSLRWWARLLICIALGVVGTHSFSHGLFIWPAVFVAALFRPEGRGSEIKGCFSLSLDRGCGGGDRFLFSVRLPEHLPIPPTHMARRRALKRRPQHTGRPDSIIRTAPCDSLPFCWEILLLGFTESMHCHWRRKSAGRFWRSSSEEVSGSRSGGGGKRITISGIGQFPG